MRVAVFRGHLTLNHGPDSSEALVDRLRMLGHEVLHKTAVARPGQDITEGLERDLVQPGSLESFAPEALAIVISSPDHAHYPRELIDATVRAGGTVVYVGPANNATGESPARQFLAERGFYFESITAGGPQPVRSWSDVWVELPMGTLESHEAIPFAAFDAVYFLAVRTPFVLAAQPRQTTILKLPEDTCCLWDGTPLPTAMRRIGVIRETEGREILVTGDWLSPSSLAVLACNTQFIANLLTGAVDDAPFASGQPSAVHTSPPAREVTNSLMISAPIQTKPFVDFVAHQLGERGVKVLASADDTDRSGCIPGDISAFVPVIDSHISKTQAAEIAAAIAASRHDPDGFRLVPLNFRPGLDPNQETGLLRELAEWVWLPAYDSREWNRILNLSMRALCRPRGRFSWGRGRRIFLSYCFRDYHIARELSERLVAIGLDVFIADETTLMNSELRSELARLIAECDVFVPVVTAEYRKSNWSFVEAEVAIERCRAIGKPEILLYAAKGSRIPNWYSGFKVCGDIKALEQSLTSQCT